MKKKMLLSVLFLVLVASCSGNVTETGNPCPSGSCPAATPNISGEAAPYASEAYGVTITPPDGWTYEVVSDSSVRFESPSTDYSTADVTFERLVPVPQSLFEYLSDTYPGRVFVQYTTSELVGYMYENENVESATLREYFFLKGDVLVHVEVEVRGVRLAEVGQLLHSITFN